MFEFDDAHIKKFLELRICCGGTNLIPLDFLMTNLRLSQLCYVIMTEGTDLLCNTFRY